jgi:hypothetical protein
LRALDAGGCIAAQQRAQHEVRADARGPARRRRVGGHDEALLTYINYESFAHVLCVLTEPGAHLVQKTREIHL